jgi:hypothetical protein
VKVNREAGSRTSSSTEGGWKNAVKVNQEAGNRSSASDNDGIWRASVKVNTEAGNRSSGVLNDSGSKDALPPKTGVRILNEPGGSGADMYGTLYGNHERHPRPEESPQAEVGDDSVGNVEMAASTGAADQHVSEAEQDEDIDVQDATQDDEKSEICTGDQEDTEESTPLEASGSAGVGADPVESTRITLPPVHPFFSGAIPEEDLEVLRRALAVVSTTLLPVGPFPG